MSNWLTETGLFSRACALFMALAVIPAMAADRVTGEPFAELLGRQFPLPNLRLADGIQHFHQPDRIVVQSGQ